MDAGVFLVRAADDDETDGDRGDQESEKCEAFEVRTFGGQTQGDQSGRETDKTDALDPCAARRLECSRAERERNDEIPGEHPRYRCTRS